MQHKEINDFVEAIHALGDRTPTILLPCFVETSYKTYIDEVIERCRQVMTARPLVYTRIYMMMEEGISEKHSKMIFRACHVGSSVMLKELLTTDAADYVAVYSFGGVPSDILRMVCDAANRVEIVDEVSGLIVEMEKIQGDN